MDLENVILLVQLDLDFYFVGAHIIRVDIGLKGNVEIQFGGEIFFGEFQDLSD